MLIYNSQMHKKQEFKPIEPGKVRMYVCGPTVYDQIHIGNARTFLCFDVIRRYLTYKGYAVTFAQNLTDVDDKIINRANEQGRTAAEVAEEYSQAFIEQMHRFGILDPDIRPRATREIAAMQEMIQGLIDQGYAYAVPSGDVYFSVRSDTNYGIVSGRNVDELMSGARIEENEQKRDPLDFALWKAAKPGEPSWPSPWGNGRPGWHTECVAMIHRYLGVPIDIHGGGSDLIFPHHENETAQCMCNWHTPLANVWMHTGMLTIDGEKMSKSLGNTLWAKDVLDRLGTNLTRWLMSSVHYRKELNFSEETIDTARKELEKVLTPIRQYDIKSQLAKEAEPEGYEEASFRAFLDQMDDDMNTPNAYTVIFETVRRLNSMLRTREPDWKEAGKLRNSVVKMLDILGIRVETPVVSEEDRKLFAKWNDAKQAKDFAAADGYRAELMAKGLL